MLLLLLLSHFSRVRLCVTPYTVAHQAPPSLGFSRQEHWSGMPFPSPMHESEKWKGSHWVVSDSSRPHGLQPTRLLHPWDFPGKEYWSGVPLPSPKCYLDKCYLDFWKMTPYGCAGSTLPCGLLSSCGCSSRGTLASRGTWPLEHELSSCGSRAKLFRGMWDFPGLGIGPTCPALAGGFSATEPPGKS